MPAHADILDQKEPIGLSFAGSLILHISVAAGILGYGAFQASHRESWGDPNGGGMGAVPVSVVSIRLPTPTGPANPVANDTESHVPEPKPTPKPPPKVKPAQPDPNAIALKSKKAVQEADRPFLHNYTPPNKFREQQTDRPNQMYSTQGQQVSSPMYAMAGAGGVGIGTDSPLGTRFGWYATIIRNKVAENWHADARFSGTPEFVVRFTLLRDGSVVPSSVKVVQGSGNAPLDLSAERAILDASPFGPLPPQFEQSQADLELHFVLRR